MGRRLDKKSIYIIREKFVEKLIFDLLKDIGVPASRKGYRYIIDAILIVLSDEKSINKMGDMIYSKIAIRYNTKKSAVERAITTAIEKIALDGDVDLIYEIFGNTISSMKGKPTNKEFIAMFISKIKVERNIKTEKI